MGTDEKGGTTSSCTKKRKTERSMSGIKLKDKIQKTVIKEKTKIPDIIKGIRTLKWKWPGHICKIQQMDKKINTMNTKGRESRKRKTKKKTERYI